MGGECRRRHLAAIEVRPSAVAGSSFRAGELHGATARASWGLIGARRGNAMSRIDIEIKGLFATPVAAVVLPDAEARNAELQEVILRRRAENPSIGASNMGGWDSTRDVAAWGGKRAQEDLEVARDVAVQAGREREG